MDIRLVTEDTELFEICREVLSEIPEYPCTLSAVPLDRANTGADLYIWDFDPEFPIPDAVLRTSHQINSYRVDILDSGTPIPEKWIKRIFEEHTSYGGGSDRAGGGLGLAICRFIVHQHEGAIWAENTERGPMFSFVLPAFRAESSCEISSDLEEMERVCL